MKIMMVTAAVAALLVASVAIAAQNPVSVAQTTTKTATIVAIDKTARVVTLQGKEGLTFDVLCGSEVQRFDALKVGDTVTFTYHESVISAIGRPGDKPKDPLSTNVTRTAGAKPGGTVAQQLSATVTIEEIDPKIPSVSVKAADGRRMAFKVEDKKNLEGYKVGDKVTVTYTQALAVSVK